MNDHPAPAQDDDPAGGVALPPADALLKGGMLAVLAAAAFAVAARTLRSSPLFAPAAVALAGLGLISGWAAAIQLTGGEKFDDHPWV